MELADILLILPAAGKSSRLGSPKGLQMHVQRTWLEIQCQSYANAGGKVVALVLGYDRERYLETLGCMPEKMSEAIAFGGCSLHVLDNLAPEYGPFSSLKRACSWIGNDTSFLAAFFHPIDTPLPSAAVLQQLCAAMRTGITVVQPRFDGCGGHPVLLSRAFLHEMTTLDDTLPDSRLNQQIRKQREIGAVVSVPVTDARVTLNLNHAEAWEQYFKSVDVF